MELHQTALMRLAVVIVGVLCAYSMLAWAYVFSQVIKNGQWIAYEPVSWIIHAELYLAIAFAVISVACVGYAILSNMRRR